MDQDDEQTRLLAARRRLDRLAWLLDDSIRVPGTNRRFGLDPIIGLVPGVGDAVGGVISLWLVVEAARLGAPGNMLVRMVGNVLLESIVGLVPVLGDLFDFWWKANTRNRDMLAAYIDHQLTPERDNRTWLWVLLAVFVLMLALLFYPRIVHGPVF